MIIEKLTIYYIENVKYWNPFPFSCYRVVDEEWPHKPDAIHEHGVNAYTHKFHTSSKSVFKKIDHRGYHCRMSKGSIKIMISIKMNFDYVFKVIS